MADYRSGQPIGVKVRGEKFMVKYATKCFCTDCGTYSHSGAMVTASDCNFCEEMNQTDKPNDEAA
ncbi:hypothetical protein [Bacillus kwashiorkori]|uniref:hypothetical protein n=1 Tax=Bacillus kwashiorkori TaxID=1522318 RepID=UPI000782B1B2|nr:hypothetical protein [Bacillus kwashiorkori]